MIKRLKGSRFTYVRAKKVGIFNEKVSDIHSGKAKMVGLFSCSFIPLFYFSFSTLIPFKIWRIGEILAK